MSTVTFGAEVEQERALPSYRIGWDFTNKCFVMEDGTGLHVSLSAKASAKLLEEIKLGEAGVRR